MPGFFPYASSGLRAFLLAVVMVAVAWLPARAQTFLQDTQFTVGTVTVDGSGQDWAYVLALAGDTSGAPMTGTMAVFAKDGEPGDPGDYSLLAVVRPQRNPTTVNALLQRSTHVGQDLVDLEERIDTLFEDYIPAPNLSLSEKLAAILQASLEFPELLPNLALLSRNHPGVAMALGYAYAAPIESGQVVTFEVRRCPDAVLDPTAQCLQVIGRVTVEAGNPVALPAAFAPLHVPLDSPTDNLQARLRWDIPDSLRRLGLLQFGYRVWRVPEEIAVDEGIDTGAPTQFQLDALAGLYPGEVVPINDAPILTNPTEDFFIVDDNFLADDNPRFVDGTRNYYYVEALDVLGRPGLPSMGTLVVICDKMRPPVPEGLALRALRRYDPMSDTDDQNFELTFDQNPDSTSDPTNAYAIYLWSDTNEKHETVNAGERPDPLSPAPVAVIPHIPGQEKQTWVHEGFGAPNLASNVNETLWYSVRAIKFTACGNVYSGNSASIFGVLRDWVGPDIVSGSLFYICRRPQLQIFGEAITDIRFPNRPGEREFQFETSYFPPGLVRWMEYYTGDPGNGTGRLLARKLLPENASSTQHLFTVAVDDLVLNLNGSPQFTIIAEAPDGTRSDPLTFSQFVSPNARAFYQIDATSDERRLVAGNPIDDDGGLIPCDRHIVVGPGGTINCLDVEFTLDPTTRQVRLYRRFGDGPLTLVEARRHDASINPVVFFELCEFPPLGGPVTLYGHGYDEHGNPGIIFKAGTILATPKELPTPLLAEPSPAGDINDRKMLINWFCPPYGLARFKVYIGSEAAIEDTEPQVIDLTNVVAQLQLKDMIGDDDFQVITTGRIGETFQSGPAFSLLVDVDPGINYTVYIEGVSPDGISGPASNEETFLWTDPTLEGPNVPWPARPLPFVGPTFNSNVEAVYLDNLLDPSVTPPWQGAAVRIGEFYEEVFFDPPGSNQNDFFTAVLPFNPNDFVYENADKTRSLLPMMLYRVQVPNLKYPANRVSGDVYQVSPLIEEIAHTVIGSNTNFYDPYIKAALYPGTPNPSGFANAMYLVDTQPQIRGAAYRYLVVLFDEETGEVEKVVPTNTVEIP